MTRKKARLTEHDPLESKTDGILNSFSQIQQVEKSGSQQDRNLKNKKAEKLASQQVQLKKATYKLNKAVIDRLDRAYLQMSLDRGKEDTPYKEVLVEEAISNFLDQLEQDPDLVEQVLIRQETRQ